MKKYILSIDQSTQGTKALLFDSSGCIIERKDISHRQIVNDLGWVEHDPEEIYQNTLSVIQELVSLAGINEDEIGAAGISNQRETAMVWERETGKPVYHAIVWQCCRGREICEEIEKRGYASMIRKHTGLQLSPYFSAAKIAWILRHVPGAGEKAKAGKLCCGTMDSWLVYKLTGGKRFQTDYSNASRTQMFNIHTLKWDREVCELFSIPLECLADVTDSDGDFGSTDFEGKLKCEVPICAVMGDSHGALFGQGCVEKGMVKATYGTGSSVMMNIGKEAVLCENLVTSLAWRIGGEVNYVVEGNINYTGGVITWMKDEMNLISSPDESEKLAKTANQNDTTYLIPAFSGLGAPYWDSEAKAHICGMTRRTGRAEIVKAGVECIAYQIADVMKAMSEETGIFVQELRADGGATKNAYLMQFQSNIAAVPVRVPEAEEFSGIGAAYAAGLAAGIYDRQTVFSNVNSKIYRPGMDVQTRNRKYQGWKAAVKQGLKNKTEIVKKSD